MALIVQNGDIYEDQLGPKYAPIRDYWREPTQAKRLELAAAVSEEGFKDEFLNDVGLALAERFAPDLWKLHWSLMTPQRRAGHWALETNLDEIVPLVRAFLQGLSRYERGEAPVVRVKNREK